MEFLIIGFKILLHEKVLLSPSIKEYRKSILLTILIQKKTVL